jgi:ribosome-associated heat shock protein Hsp15
VAGTAGRNDNRDERHRLDRWLWFARFFRSRSLAAAAVAGGKVRVNGERAKPSRDVAVGDCLDICRGMDGLTVTVRALPDRRGPAPAAAESYRENPDSVARRAAAREHRRRDQLLRVAPPGRPDKRGRRAIRQLQGRD